MAQQTKKPRSAVGKNGASSARKNSSRAKEEARAAAERRRIFSIVLFFYGIFMLFVTYIPGAGFWHTLYDFNRGLFGVSVFIFAPLIIYVSIMIATDKSQNAVITKLLQGMLVILLFCGLSQIILVGSVEGKTALLKIKGLYNDGVKLRGGGLLSALFGWTLLAVFKRVGATIIIILLTLFFFFMLSNWTLPDVWNFITKPFRAGYNAVKEEQQERMTRAGSVPPKDENKKNRRVDIAKYYIDDEPDDNGYEAFSDIDELERLEKNEGRNNEEIILPPRPFGPKPKKRNYFDEIDNLRGSRTNLVPEDDYPVSDGAASFGDDDSGLSFSDLDGEQINEQAERMQQVIDRSAKLPAEEPFDEEASEKSGEQPAQEEYDDEEIFVDENGQASFIDQTVNEKPQKLPPVSLLKTVSNAENAAAIDLESQQRASTLVETLKSFGVQTRVVGIHRGPSVTRYELQPAVGVKISKITSLADDIALNLAAQGVRIEAPIPGKAAVGIELSNTTRETVSLRELIEDREFTKAKGKLCFAVGKNIEGGIVMSDIRKMPHLLIAGTTGSGKSVFTNSIIMNILYRATSDEVKLMLIDPKQVEFKIYNGIPHLLAPVITEPRKAAGALAWAVTEMTRRYSLFSDNSVREFDDYNELAAQSEKLKPLEHIVIIIDELADLMMAASKEVEDSICRLAQLARAAGMHLIIATQSPRVDVVTGLIKANLPSRVALKVSNNMDSRIILDEGGAEKLLGNGDMLFKPVGLDKPLRIQGSYVSSAEIRAVVKFLKDQRSAAYDDEVLDGIEKNIPVPKGEKPQTDYDTDAPRNDDMLEAAIKIVVESRQASTSFLQRKLNLGYARAARIMDNMEAMGIVGPAVGAKPREVKMSVVEWQEREAVKSVRQ